MTRPGPEEGTVRFRRKYRPDKRGSGNEGMMKLPKVLLTAGVAGLLCFSGACATQAQDWVKTGTNLGAQRIRIAAANFKPSGADPQIA